jgi:hypothetical protein
MAFPGRKVEPPDKKKEYRRWLKYYRNK